MNRVYNFSAGPAALPLPVLEQVQAEMVEYPGQGMSILEMSHRSAVFEAIIQSAENGIRSLLAVPEGYHVLFLQGGASLQFSMVPSNLLPAGRSADYIVTGIWGQKAYREARKVGSCRLAAVMESANFARVPTAAEIALDAQAAYLHLTTNETIGGVQWQTEPEVGGLTLVADASSDILSRPIDVARYGLIYAGAQKNIGPAGVTIVIVRDDLLKAIPKGLPAMLDYGVQAKSKSLYNTPNTFGIYVIDLVCKHLQKLGGLTQVRRNNEEKAKLLYDVIDASRFYRGHAAPDSRSRMNVTFRLPEEALEKRFVQEAAGHGMIELKGHRDVGGVRASIYNAFPLQGVEQLVSFMREFERANG